MTTFSTSELKAFQKKLDKARKLKKQAEAIEEEIADKFRPHVFEMDFENSLELIKSLNWYECLSAFDLICLSHNKIKK